MASASYRHFNSESSSSAWMYIINMDGRGYYGYLPAVFIYDDPTYQFHLEHNAQHDPNINFTHELDNGKRLNKYFIGEAVLLTPFFLLAHVVSSITDFVSTGYSLPYYVSVAVGAVFYVTLGLWLLSIFLNRQFKNQWVSTAAPLLILFGSNLFYYAVYEPSMSHAYSFFLVCAFLFLGSLASQKPSRIILFITGLTVGLIAITRPVNLIILGMLPFLLVDARHLPAATFSKAFKILLQVLVPVVAVIAIQVAAYKWQTGNWLVYSYGNEGFNWSNPQLFNTLFSYKRGLFVYAPICLLSLVGLKHLWSFSSIKTLSLLSTLLFAIYVVSSWHAWGYGWAYGLRAYVEFLPLFAILLSALMAKARPRRLAVLGLTALLCITYVQIQTHQVTEKILPLAGVNEQEFWKIFLRF